MVQRHAACPPCSGVVQLVEHSAVNGEVVGSNPTARARQGRRVNVDIAGSSPAPGAVLRLAKKIPLELTLLPKYYKMPINMENILNTMDLEMVLRITKVKACFMFGSFFGFKKTTQGCFGSNSC